MQCYHNPIQAAVIGDFQRNDFQSVVRLIREKTATIFFDTLALFQKTDGLAQNYELIFLLASSFDQYSSNDVRHLQARRPLARIVMIAGSLAEGEGRTGWLPPDLIRCYWYQWETEVLPVFTSFCDRQISPWGLPLTAPGEERILATATFMEHTKPIPNKSQKKVAVIIADDSAMRELLVDWVTQKGFRAEMWQATDFLATTASIETEEILFDVASENLAETVFVVQLLKNHRPSSTRLIVFYNSPRPDEIRQLNQAGADCIVAKPFFFL